MTLDQKLLLYAQQFEDQHAPENITTTLREAAAEIERLREWNAEIALNAREFVAENERLRQVLDNVQQARVLQGKAITEASTEIERLRAALESVMIGGNHLATIIGATHPQAGVHHEAALQFYGPGHQYDAWCCWNAIMQARAALEGRT